MSGLERWLAQRRAEVDGLLEARLPARPRDSDPGRLIKAMRYSLLAPGKRLRPILALAAAEAVGGSAHGPTGESLRLATAAVELVHCYSLIHDDLPAMDDDDVRRGRPTNHKVFGEATAILAGDALLTLAFDWIAEAGATAAGRPAGDHGRPGDYLAAIAALAREAGMWGMVRGQARDLGEAAPAVLEDLERLHAEKTAGLFRAAVQVGGAAGGATVAETAALVGFADAYGVAFQHADDAHDGQHAGLAARARERITALTAQAVAALEGFGDRAIWLRALADALGGKL